MPRGDEFFYCILIFVRGATRVAPVLLACDHLCVLSRTTSSNRTYCTANCAHGLLSPRRVLWFEFSPCIVLAATQDLPCIGWNTASIQQSHAPSCWLLLG